ncbi:hypothetical protein FT641_27015 [Bacillus paranthracis]|uniref:hypothetical protein n=1 Tax=Bacillus paranthracis TaxID=2026186 RepID=UPI00187A0FD9|nr:hypothetical protein [Bacillus paranthracis]MBE7117304.1 hypothetical protein [Bacillus paranthracis]MBE7134918.1 hypothetical protein [Bacillus paranthracis]MBE7156327.1 hypothetical protein [Bacillus paranthracis]
MTIHERLLAMEVKKLREEKATLLKKVEELEEGEAYEVETEFNGMTIRMDYATYRQFMKDMAAGVFNGNG